IDEDSLTILIFFFQAEDGIRDFHVTGVQTCALPISGTATLRPRGRRTNARRRHDPRASARTPWPPGHGPVGRRRAPLAARGCPRRPECPGADGPRPRSSRSARPVPPPWTGRSRAPAAPPAHACEHEHLRRRDRSPSPAPAHACFSQHHRALFPGDSQPADRVLRHAGHPYLLCTSTLTGTCPPLTATRGDTCLESFRGTSPPNRNRSSRR